MLIKTFSIASLFLAAMMGGPAATFAQAPSKVVTSPAPTGKMVTQDQAHQETQAPALSTLRAQKSAEMKSNPQSAVRTPAPNGQMILRDGPDEKPQD